MNKIIFSLFLMALLVSNSILAFAGSSCCMPKKKACKCTTEECCKDKKCNCQGECCKDGECNCMKKM